MTRTIALACFALLPALCVIACGGRTAGAADAGADADSDGDAGADASGDAGADADVELEPTPVRFVLRFVSDVPESIWIADGHPAAHERFWVSVWRSTEEVHIAADCICPCDACPCDIDCELPCASASEIASGSSAELDWDGVEHARPDCPASATEICQLSRAAPPGSYIARFCWGLGAEGTETCQMAVPDPSCADVAFRLPGDGVVGHLVDNGG